MRCYTFCHGGINDGIEVQNDLRFGKVLRLGEEGRGRRVEKVSLFKKNPAEVSDDRIFEAHPVKITVSRGTKDEKHFFTLAKPNNPDDTRVLIRINTKCCYTRNSTGYWEVAKGKAEDLVKGYGAHGAAGRIGNWDDGLVVMGVDDVLRVKPEGGRKTDFYAVFLEDNLPRSMKWEEYQVKVALDNEEAEIEYI